MANENNGNGGPKLSVGQWVQITTALVTVLTGGGLWLVHTSAPAGPDFTETRAQLNDLTRQMVQMQLEQQKMEDKINYLEDDIRRLSK